MEPLQESLLAHLTQVPDVRKARGQRFAWAYLLALVAAAVAAGLVVPDEKLCKQCHNAESPTSKPFNYQEMLKKVAHPNPAKTKG